MIGEREFLRDLAITQTLPGPTFVNLSVLCGLRLGGLPFALAAVSCVLAPGVITLALALAFLPPDAPPVQGFFHGILIGAIGALVSSLLRLARNLVRALDVVLALAAFFIVVAGGSLLVAVLTVGVVGTVLHRRLEVSA